MCSCLVNFDSRCVARYSEFANLFLWCDFVFCASCRILSLWSLILTYVDSSAFVGLRYYYSHKCFEYRVCVCVAPLQPTVSTSLAFHRLSRIVDNVADTHTCASFAITACEVLKFKYSISKLKFESMVVTPTENGFSAYRRVT